MRLIRNVTWDELLLLHEDMLNMLSLAFFLRFLGNLLIKRGINPKLIIGYTTISIFLKAQDVLFSMINDIKDSCTGFLFHGGISLKGLKPTKPAQVRSLTHIHNVYIYPYIYIERQTDRQRQTDKDRWTLCTRFISQTKYIQLFLIDASKNRSTCVLVPVNNDVIVMFT